MNREIEKGTIPRGSRVLFWHTGGALGNFSYEADWADALKNRSVRLNFIPITPLGILFLSA
jgi:hypothetical protein